MGQFAVFHCASWYLDTCLGEIDMAEDEQLVAARNIRIYFVQGIHAFGSIHLIPLKKLKGETQLDMLLISNLFDYWVLQDRDEIPKKYHRRDALVFTSRSSRLPNLSRATSKS
jgi:hypothetical protein